MDRRLLRATSHAIVRLGDHLAIGEHGSKSATCCRASSSNSCAPRTSPSSGDGASCSASISSRVRPNSRHSSGATSISSTAWSTSTRPSIDSTAVSKRQRRASRRHAAELHTKPDDPTRIPISFHDLHATGSMFSWTLDVFRSRSCRQRLERTFPVRHCIGLRHRVRSTFMLAPPWAAASSRDFDGLDGPRVPTRPGILSRTDAKRDRLLQRIASMPAALLRCIRARDSRR
jgi:hypothetical protein